MSIFEQQQLHFKLLWTQLMSEFIICQKKIREVLFLCCTFVSYWYWWSYSYYYYLVLFKSYVKFCETCAFLYRLWVLCLYIPKRIEKSEWTFWNDGECVSYMKLRLLMNYVPFVRLCTFGWRGIKKCCLAFFSVVDFLLSDHIDWCGWAIIVMNYYWIIAEYFTCILVHFDLLH